MEPRKQILLFVDNPALVLSQEPDSEFTHFLDVLSFVAFRWEQGDLLQPDTSVEERRTNFRVLFVCSAEEFCELRKRGRNWSTFSETFADEAREYCLELFQLSPALQDEYRSFLEFRFGHFYAYEAINDLAMWAANNAVLQEASVSKLLDHVQALMESSAEVAVHVAQRFLEELPLTEDLLNLIPPFLMNALSELGKTLEH